MKRLGGRLVVLALGVFGLLATAMGVPAMAAGDDDNVAGPLAGSTDALIRLDVRWNDLRVWEW
jgi:hypothetical protein